MIQIRRSLFEFLLLSFEYFVNTFCKKKSLPKVMIFDLC